MVKKKFCLYVFICRYCIYFVWLGIQCNRPVNEAGEQSADQSGSQALKLVRNLCQQRNVTIQFNSLLSKNQLGFLGTLWIEKNVCF